MKDLARHLLRAGAVPKTQVQSAPLPNTRRLDSWQVESVTSREAARDISEDEPVVRRTSGRPRYATEARRDTRWVSYFDAAEDKRLTQYMKKRGLSRSDVIRELVLIGLEALKIARTNEKTPPMGGVVRK